MKYNLFKNKFNIGQSFFDDFYSNKSNIYSIFYKKDMFSFFKAVIKIQLFFSFILFIYFDFSFVFLITIYCFYKLHDCVGR